MLLNHPANGVVAVIFVSNHSVKNICKQLRSESGRFLFRSVILFIVQMLEWTNKYHFYDNVDT